MVSLLFHLLLLLLAFLVLFLPSYLSRYFFCTAYIRDEKFTGRVKVSREKRKLLLMAVFLGWNTLKRRNKNEKVSTPSHPPTARLRTLFSRRCSTLISTPPENMRITILRLKIIKREI